MKVKKVGLTILLVLIIGIAGVAIVYAGSSEETSSSSSTSSSEEVSNNESTETVDLKIEDNYFVTNMNEIYLNYEDYEGKTVSYKGLVYNYEGGIAIVRYYYCCGYDYSLVGLECNYDGKNLEDEQWVQVTGTIEVTTDNTGYTYPILNITSLEEIDGEGLDEYVSN